MLECCKEDYNTFLVEDQDPEVYKEIGTILEDFGYGPGQTKALIDEAIKFKKLKLTGFDKDKTDEFSEWLRKEKISYTLKNNTLFK